MARWKLIASAIFVVVVAIVWAAWASRSPVHLELDVRGSQAIFAIDGAYHELNWAERPSRLRFYAPQPFEREYQIDGSDTTSQGTLDWAYFARFQFSPYYRFQSWLRNEASYSRWANVRLVDTSSNVVLMHTNVVTTTEQLILPASYTLSADVYRLEKPVAIVFHDGQNNGYLLRIERDSRKVEFVQWALGGRGDVLKEWYFPESPGPFAAIIWETLARLVLWGLALAALVAGIGGVFTLTLSRRRGGEEKPRMDADSPPHDGQSGRTSASIFPFRADPHFLWLWSVLLILAASFGLTSYIAVVKYNGLPHIFDSLSLFVQAKIMASGRLSIPPPHLGLFDYPFMVSYQGRYFSQYPPGVPATISLFLRLSPSLGWLSGPVVSVATLAGVFAVARLMYGRGVALLAVLLAALSPFYNFMAGSLMSHPYSLFYLTFFLLFAVRYFRYGGGHNMAAAGALLGAALVSRESATLFFGAPWVLIVCGEALWKRGRKALPDLMLFALWFLAVSSLYLSYNQRLTGDPLRTARSLFDARDRYGFGDVGFFGRHTPAAGLIVMDAETTMLLIHLFGWPFYLTLAPALIPFVTGRFRGWDVANAISVLAFIIGFGGYYYHGIVYGPRYLYESLPFLVMLTARGFQTAGDLAAEIWQRWRGAPGQQARVASYVVLLALILCNVLYYMPRQMHLYAGYAGGAKKPDLTTIYGTRLSNAVVMSEDFFLYRDVLAPLNCIEFAVCDPVYVLIRNDKDLADARRLYAGRSFYWLREQDGRAVFVPAPRETDGGQ